MYYCCRPCRSRGFHPCYSCPALCSPACCHPCDPDCRLLKYIKRKEFETEIMVNHTINVLDRIKRVKEKQECKQRELEPKKCCTTSDCSHYVKNRLSSIWGEQECHMEMNPTVYASITNLKQTQNELDFLLKLLNTIRNQKFEEHGATQSALEVRNKLFNWTINQILSKSIVQKYFTDSLEQPKKKSKLRPKIRNLTFYQLEQKKRDQSFWEKLERQSKFKDLDMECYRTLETDQIQSLVELATIGSSDEEFKKAVLDKLPDHLKTLAKQTSLEVLETKVPPNREQLLSNVIGAKKSRKSGSKSNVRRKRLTSRTLLKSKKKYKKLMESLSQVNLALSELTQEAMHKFQFFPPNDLNRNYRNFQEPNESSANAELMQTVSQMDFDSSQLLHNVISLTTMTKAQQAAPQGGEADACLPSVSGKQPGDTKLKNDWSRYVKNFKSLCDKIDSWQTDLAGIV